MLSKWPIAKNERTSLTGIHTLGQPLVPGSLSQANCLEHGLLPNTYIPELQRPNNLDASPDASWSLISGKRSSSHVPTDALPNNLNNEAKYISQNQAPFGPQGHSPTFYTAQQPVPYTLHSTISTPSRVAPALSDSGLSSYLTHRFNNLEMVENSSYPISPQSDDHSSRRTSSIDMKTRPDHQGQHGDAASNRSYPQTFKRDRTPPRNSKDEIYCDHADCSGKREIFTRTCEWNKHMDKHERPYKCQERGCERLLGFTYSGGLLRHNREVHKKNLATRNPLYCPFSNCNRNASSGNGFTRQENLNEHKRRRHAGEEPPATPAPAPSGWPSDSSDQKRKRNLDAVDEQESASEDASDDENSPIPKRPRTTSVENPRVQIQNLRAEIRRRDERIAQQDKQLVEQDAYIQSLKTTIGSIQQQAGMARGPQDGRRG